MYIYMSTTREYLLAYCCHPGLIWRGVIWHTLRRMENPANTPLPSELKTQPTPPTESWCTPFQGTYQCIHRFYRLRWPGPQSNRQRPCPSLSPLPQQLTHLFYLIYLSMASWSGMRDRECERKMKDGGGLEGGGVVYIYVTSYLYQSGSWCLVVVLCIYVSICTIWCI